ncbi:MAG: hypothetical protein F6K14_32075 [Symploca sp. SIO2C1]|nr:hypothetical protein [Symploca sp. SIO2C1]
MAPIVVTHSSIGGSGDPYSEHALAWGERSRFWICDRILGKPQLLAYSNTQLWAQKEDWAMKVIV